MSWFSDVPMGSSVEVFALNKAFNDDTFEKKVNLGIGAYRTSKGEPWVLPVIRRVEKILAKDDSLKKEYLPCLGLDSFTRAATVMLLGLDSPAIIQSRAFGIQCLSATGALRVGAEFLARVVKKKVYYYPTPTWENHLRLFKYAGFEEGRQYRYWNKKLRDLDFDNLLEDLKNAEENAVVIFHVSAHNPTGVDPSVEQWKQIEEVVKLRNLFPFFDCSYQGFASGNFITDALAVRTFAAAGIELFCAQSFAKNFGLYNERVGNLTIVVSKPDLIPAIKSQMSSIITCMYSSPPSHGARIVSCVLNNQDLFNQWQDHIQTMASRIMEMRKLLREQLEQMETPGTWLHLTKQIGMFSYTGLNEKQSRNIVDTFHIYMLRSGRINICGLNNNNVYYVAQAIHHTVTSLPDKKQKFLSDLMSSF